MKRGEKFDDYADIRGYENSKSADFQPLGGVRSKKKSTAAKKTGTSFLAAGGVLTGLGMAGAGAIVAVNLGVIAMPAAFASLVPNLLAVNSVASFGALFTGPSAFIMIGLASFLGVGLAALGTGAIISGVASKQDSGHGDKSSFAAINSHTPHSSYQFGETLDKHGESYDDENDVAYRETYDRDEDSNNEITFRPFGS